MAKKISVTNGDIAIVCKKAYATSIIFTGGGMDTDPKKVLDGQDETTNIASTDEQSAKAIDETANIALPNESIDTQSDEKLVDEQPATKTENIALSETSGNIKPEEFSTDPPSTSYHELYNEQKPDRHRHYKYIIAGLLIVLAFALGVFGTLIYTKKQTDDNKKPNSAQPTVTPIAAKDDSKNQTTPVKETIKWLDTPVTMAVQPIYNEQWYKDNYSNNGQPIIKKDDLFKFYQVGSLGDDQYIIATVMEPGTPTMLLKKSGDSFTLYQQHSPRAFYAATEGGQPEYFGPTLANTVRIDKTSLITDIVNPDSINVGGQDFKKAQFAQGNGIIVTKTPSADGTTYTEKKTTSQGTIYEVTTKKEQSYSVSYYALMTKDHRIHPYVLDGEVLLLNTTQPITWTNGNKNTIQYVSAVGGCSFSQASEVGTNITDASVEASGKSANGTSVYTIKDLNNPLLLKHYNEYKDVILYDNQLPANEKNMTISQFKQNNGIYLAKDGLGRWIVMTNPNYFPMGGCAKPVVYLYPTITTLAGVSVGADVTKSEPLYPVGGWKGVLAQPNGNLQYQGKAYDSLFWEGYGKGAYPEITSGSFVKHADAEQKIKADLAQQGLNSKEINDFWAFWSAKIPNKQYVRITWLGKSQLQTLAPLYVTPKPDTVIRVFLDMEGVDAPYRLAQQSLFAPKRTGFTVVEWGGLARDGSVPKIQ